MPSIFWCLLITLKQGLFPRKCLVCCREGALGCASHPLPKKSARLKIFIKPQLLVLAASDYQSKMSQNLVKALKFNRQKSALKPMVELMSQTINWETYSDYTLVPIPLHWSRRWWRGFNQAELLAVDLSHKTGLRHQPWLKKIKRTPSQAWLSKGQRSVNLSGVFAGDRASLAPKKIILIDDVCTTGATLKTAARTLKLAGAENIIGLVFAHQKKG